MGMSRYDELASRAMSHLNNQDWEAAFSLLKSKVEQNDANAKALLAEFYIYGIGIPEDIERGLEMLKTAVEEGCREAADTLTILYLQGNVVPINVELGVKYLKRGAQMGHPVSMGKLAATYLFGDYGMQDNKLAFEWAQKASKSGDCLGMECMAIIYDDGIGVYKDPIQAAYLYRECLQRNPENAFYMYRLAVCLADPFEDFNLHPDIGMLEEAYSWACKGVEQGDLDCHMLVAWFYETGNVVMQDYGTAHKYLKIAADNGHEISTELIKRYRRNIFGNYYISQ